MRGAAHAGAAADGARAEGRLRAGALGLTLRLTLKTSFCTPRLTLKTSTSRRVRVNPKVNPKVQDFYEQARREEELRRRLERHDDDLVRARAATEAARYAQHTCIYTYTYPAMVGYAQASMQTPLPEP